MKSRNQSGSAHVVIIIVLIVAVLGALGFIFWQNFVNKSANMNSSTSTSEQTEDQVSSDTSTITIGEWGVKGTYDTSADDATVSYVIRTNAEADVSSSSDDYELVYFDTSSVPSDCKGYGGVIKRFTADQEVQFSAGAAGVTSSEMYAQNGGDTDKFKKVGNYYYWYEGPQSACGTDEDDPAEVAASYMVGVTKDFMASLTAR